MVRFFAMLVVVWVAGSCGLLSKNKIKDHKSGTGEPQVDKVEVKFDSSVPGWQEDLIDKDLEILSDAGLVDGSQKDTLGIGGFSNEDLRAWLSARLSYVVGERFDESSVSIERSSFPYSPQVGSISLTAPTIIMANLGGAYYRDGKARGRLYSLEVAGDKVIIDSPRVNVIQIGEGLFSVDKVPGSKDDDDVNSYLRIATIFHEGRHGDGNSDNVAFAHQACPSRSSYAGEYACDDSTNGAYSVGRVILEKLRGICNFCSSKEKTALDLSVADLSSRLLDGAVTKDPRPERVNH